MKLVNCVLQYIVNYAIVRVEQKKKQLGWILGLHMTLIYFN